MLLPLETLRGNSPLTAEKAGEYSTVLPVETGGLYCDDWSRVDLVTPACDWRTRFDGISPRSQARCRFRRGALPIAARERAVIVSPRQTGDSQTSGWRCYAPPATLSVQRVEVQFEVYAAERQRILEAFDKTQKKR